MRHERLPINWLAVWGFLFCSVIWTITFVIWGPHHNFPNPLETPWITLQQQRYAVCPEEFTCYVNNNGGPMIAFKTVVKHWDGTVWKDGYK